MYFEVINFNNYDDISWFIYAFVKYYQCETRLDNVDELQKLDALVKELIILYKNKLTDTYDSVIQEKYNVYENSATVSKDSIDKEKYEIFVKIFM